MDNVLVKSNNGAPMGRHEAEPVRAQPTVKRRGFRKLFVILMSIIVVIAVVVTAFLIMYQPNTNTVIDSNKYQAVFFTNGQVYFGKLQTLNGSYMRLTDIFYLQTKTPDPTNPQQTSTATTPDVQLVPLGNEIHGPTDEMIISNTQVLFFENLKPDGKVSQSISTYHAKNSK
jgi:hypothetical protein